MHRWHSRNTASAMKIALGYRMPTREINRSQDRNQRSTEWMPNTWNLGSEVAHCIAPNVISSQWKYRCANSWLDHVKGKKENVWVCIWVKVN